MSRRLKRSFFSRHPLVVAPELLGKILVSGKRSGRIVEVEAYGGDDDPGSHGHRGPTPRNEVMFGPPGRLYVYFTYGMHWCANVVCGEEGHCAAVLIRALEPMRGVESMYEARPAARGPRDLCNGPAKLCQALGMDGTHNGVDLVSAEAGIEIRDDGAAIGEIASSLRVGLGRGKGDELPWRFYVCGNPNVSGRPR